jgi:hypothetical protein
MKHITLHNYEAFLLDFSEARLTAEEMELLFDFIAAHPEIECDLEELESTPVLLTSHVPNKKKHTLFKDTHAEGIADIMIAVSEGVATNSEKNYLDELIAHDSNLKNELAAFSSLRLTPATNRVFSRKEFLLQEAPIRVLPWVWRIVSAAAIFAFLWVAIDFTEDRNESYAFIPIVDLSGEQSISNEQPVSSRKRDLNVNSFVATNMVPTHLEISESISKNGLQEPVKQRDDKIVLPTLSVSDIGSMRPGNPVDVPASPKNDSSSRRIEPQYLMGLDDVEEPTVQSAEQLINKITIKIDEKVEVKKENNAFYVRIGRFTVSFVKSIFSNKGEGDSEEK